MPIYAPFVNLSTGYAQSVDNFLASYSQLSTTLDIVFPHVFTTYTRGHIYISYPVKYYFSPAAPILLYFLFIAKKPHKQAGKDF